MSVCLEEGGFQLTLPSHMLDLIPFVLAELPTYKV